ncbi:MAG: 23S rRNA (adenine(2030)-N(6))-methyltransferase RlmJ [Treponema sp.]|nr:23S rRNA (adenine(2030)-N(6))-methyltransferase RlmJ [Treponema sp.]
MLSYIHAYHAGNHADILKHLTLSLILQSLAKKEKPFTIIDSHAGSGLYDLHDPRARKTGEACSGIEKLLNSSQKFELSPDTEASFKKFTDFFSSFYARGKYPGSPLIENAFLREGDRQILCELHPKAFDELRETFYLRKKEFREAGKIFIEPAIHKRDGYELLTALTPPKIKRGLALMDPSFEDASDYEKCGRVISSIHKKWPAGIIALWYPLLSHRSTEISMMKEAISASVDSSEPKILDIQLEVKMKEEMTGLASLYGSGMFIVNFPYQLDTKMKEILPSLSQILGQSSRQWSVECWQ